MPEIQRQYVLTISDFLVWTGASSPRTTAREGDLVVVLYGGSVPHILREAVEAGVDSTRQMLYKFVGECYLQGKMDGSAVRDQQGEGLAMESFTLI